MIDHKKDLRFTGTSLGVLYLYMQCHGHPSMGASIAAINNEGSVEDESVARYKSPSSVAKLSAILCILYVGYFSY